MFHFALCFDLGFLIVLHHGYNNVLFYFDMCNQIHTFNNNLKDEEMIISHLKFPNRLLNDTFPVFATQFVSLLQSNGINKEI